MLTHYNELGVHRNATSDAIRAAFRRQALVVHPDKGGSNQAFQRVMVAFETLSDTALRLRYDRRLSAIGGDQRREDPPPSRKCRRAAATADEGRWRARGASVAEPSGHEPECSVPKGPEAQAAGPKAAATSEPGPARPTGRTDSRRSEARRPTVAEPIRFQGPSTTTTSPPDSACAPDLRMLRKMLQLMQMLSKQRRLVFIESSLTPGLRIELEACVLAQRRAKDTAAPTSLIACPAAADDAEEYSSTCSRSSSPEGDGDSESFAQLQDLPEDSASEASECDGISSDEGDASESFAFRNQEAPFRAHLALPRSSVAADGDREPVASGDQQAPRGRSSVRGLYTRYVVSDGVRQYSHYSAGVCIDSVQMITRRARDLPLALDWLLILSEIKQRVKDGTGVASFSRRLREAFAETLEKHVVPLESLGLSFSLQLSKKFWVGSILTTPVVHSVDVILDALERLAPYQGRVGVTSRCILFDVGLATLEKEWAAFKSTFLDICAAAGQCRSELDSRLKAREELQKPFREELLEGWNRRCMAADEERQRRCRKEERRRETRCRRAMSQEDRRSRMTRRRAQLSETRILTRLLVLLSRWKRRNDKRKVLERDKRVRNRAAEIRRREAAAKAAAISAKILARSSRKAREERWREMNRRDLTMDDIFERRWSSVAPEDQH